jgi:hypothetical protein
VQFFPDWENSEPALWNVCESNRQRNSSINKRSWRILSLLFARHISSMQLSSRSADGWMEPCAANESDFTGFQGETAKTSLATNSSLT